MTTERAHEPIAIAIEVSEPSVADRLAALLTDLPGVRLAAPGKAGGRCLGLTREGASCRFRCRVDSTREIEVLALLAEGASNKLIASRLGISVHTAKFHVGSLLDKLDATGRTDAIAHAVRLGVIHL